MLGKLRIGVLVLCLVTGLACRSTSLKSSSSVMLRNPAYDNDFHEFVLNSELYKRNQPIPPFILKTLKAMDKRDNYKNYVLTTHEQQLLREYIALLSPLTRRVMQNRLLGIYFVENFRGSGLTDWFVDRNNTVYSYMVFNADVLKQDLSELLTVKERTCFRSDDPSIAINIDCSKPYNGLLYILLHESTHVVDYANNITPYVEEATRGLKGLVPKYTLFTLGTWDGYNKTVKDYPFRKNVTFYGFGGGPKFSRKNAVAIYDSLNASEFVSLYATLNWAEDLAETVAFYSLVKILGVRYRVRITKNRKKLIIYEPFQFNEQFKKRLQTIQHFYQ